LGGTGGDALTEEKKMYGAHPSLLPPARRTDEAVLGRTTLSFLFLEQKAKLSSAQKMESSDPAAVISGSLNRTC
jgi:hypothetical protein